MDDVDPIYSVAVDPVYCPQCGTELGTREFDAGTYRWCPDCEMSFARNPLAAVHVVVVDGDEVLLLDEPIPQQEGVLSLPGGHAGHDEGPREAVVRELHEETGLRADPGDLSLVTVYHAETPRTAYHFATYRLDYADARGEVTPEAEGFEAALRPLDAVLSGDLSLRDSDVERIGMAVE